MWQNNYRLLCRLNKSSYASEKFGRSSLLFLQFYEVTSLPLVPLQTTRDSIGKGVLKSSRVYHMFVINVLSRDLLFRVVA